MQKYFFITVFFFISFLAFGQRGKHGNYTATSQNQIVNTYTYMTTSANAGATSITVANNQMAGGGFTNNLQAGDLLLIYQIQGVYTSINDWYINGWGAEWTVQLSWPDDPDDSFIKFGDIELYYNTGMYQLVEVAGISGSNQINLSCPLDYAFQAGLTQHRKVLVVRVPRYNNLTVPTNTSLTAKKWDGTTGGVIALEVNGTLSINGTGKIHADEKGFRGGQPSTNDGTMTGVPGAISDTSSRGFLGTYVTTKSGEKGESIMGTHTDYENFSSRYGYGAIANGGGGGYMHNAGGGGGSNVGTGNYYGYGVVDPGPSNSYVPAWNQEDPFLVNNPSAGGGRGGYSHVGVARDPLTVGPHNVQWDLDYRKISGGVGGHPLTYQSNRMFMGGGGGGGHQNDNWGGKGGDGGGSVFLQLYGQVTGNGTISANGGNGGSTEGPDLNPLTQGGVTNGQDGAGGAGGGGAIVIRNTQNIPSSIKLYANGGKGGDEIIKRGTTVTSVQANGPGGGGAGGMVSFSAGNPTQQVLGGANGITSTTGGFGNGNIMANFPPNGATKGGPGMRDLISQAMNVIVANDTVCYGTSATITPTIIGNMTGVTLSWYTSYSATTPIYTGNSYTTPALTTTQTYYVGSCRSAFRVPVEIFVNPNLLVSGTPIITPESCYGNQGGISGLNASGGTAPYTYSWNGTSTPSSTLTGATQGTYTLTVTDARGCTRTSGPHTIGLAPNPIINSTNVTITQETCIGNDGTISGVTVSGGTAPYTYLWNSNPALNTLNLSGLSSGTYNLLVIDSKGCMATAGPFTVTAASTININTSNLSITGETCIGNNGTITGITASGGVGTLTYSWSNSGGNGLNVNAVPAGFYTLTVTDANNCSTTSGPHQIPAIANPVIDDANVLISDESCHGNDGAITGLIVTSTETPLTYQWSGQGTPSPDENLPGVPAGTYTLTVTDGNNCSTTSNAFTVGTASIPVLDETNVTVLDASCNDDDGSISGITVSGGVGSYTYVWNVTPSGTINLSGAEADDYVLTVYDANNCSVSSNSYTVGTIPNPVVDATNIVIKNETCLGYDGEITGLTVSGGVAPYSFDWGGGPSANIDLENSDQGSFTLTVTDANGCTGSSGPYTIGAYNPIVINDLGVSVVMETCFGNDGEVTGIIASGGTGILSYSWDNGGGTSLDLIGAVAGDYTLTVTDEDGCSQTSGIHSILQTVPPVINTTGMLIADESCIGNDGSITGISVIGIGMPFTYTWNGVTSANADLNGATAGNYTLVVSDVNGCTATQGPITIGLASMPSIDASSVVINAETCIGNNGSISGIVVSGGTIPYTYTWNGNVESGSDLNNLAPNDYTLVVTDANGCQDTDGPFTVGAYSPILVNENNLVITDETCNGSLGSISGLTASGGSGTLTYLWSNNATTLDINNLSVGIYYLTVADGVNCSETFGPYTVQQIGAPTINSSGVNIVHATCGNSNGSISGITVTGGVEPYAYSWNGNPSNDLSLSNLSDGSYSLSITDASGCTAVAGPFVVNDQPGPTIDASGITTNNETCDGNDGSVIGFSVTGGNGPYSYSWNGVQSTTIDLVNTHSGNHTLTVTDANGCTATSGPHLLGGPIIPTVDITTANTTIEEGESVNIEAMVTPTNATINWNPTQDLSCNDCLNPVATPTQSTWYVLTATSSDNCSSSDSIYVKVDQNCSEVSIPTVFSPNDDGLNDMFCILGGCLQSMELYVYDRWGEVVFKTTDVNECWDGTHRGKPASTGVYVYRFTGVTKDGETVKESGNINLLR